MNMEPTPDSVRQVVKLRRELDAAYERIADLEGALSGLGRATPLMFGLPPQLGDMLYAIAHRDFVTHQSLAVAMGRAGRDLPDANQIKVQVCKLRKRLAPFGVEIETVWGVGYRMPAGSRAKVREAWKSGSRQSAVGAEVIDERQEAADCLARSANCLLPTARAAS